jgi:hypothetical protein
MTDTPVPDAVNTLQFARDLARLEARLADAAGEWLPLEQQSPAAAGFLVLLHELTEGTDPVPAIAKAMRAHDRVYENKREHHEASEEQRRIIEEEVAAEEEVTKKVECPFCGASAGMNCRGTGAGGGLRKRSHRDRFRLARSLNDAPSEPGGGTASPRGSTTAGPASQ